MADAVPEIDIVAFADLHGDEVVVIDVRNPHEYEEAHVPGARLIPLPDVPDRLAELPTDCAVYVVCATGARSHRASAFLRDRGVDATNVAGGTKAWMDHGRPTNAGTEP